MTSEIATIPMASRMGTDRHPEVITRHRAEVIKLLYATWKAMPLLPATAASVGHLKTTVM